jgi:hypothetical protein
MVSIFIGFLDILAISDKNVKKKIPVRKKEAGNLLKHHQKKIILERQFGAFVSAAGWSSSTGSLNYFW